MWNQHGRDLIRASHRQARTAIALAVAGFAVMATPVAAEDQFPTKDFNVVVGWEPGGGIDAYVRAVGAVAEKHFGKTFVVEYQPGGGGRVAFNNASRHPVTDGHTLLAQLVPNYVLNSLTYPEGSRGYALDQFDMLGTHACVPSSLIVKKGGQFKTLEDFTAYARAHPGAVAVSVAGARSGNEVFRATVDKALGIKTAPIVYNSGSDALKALLGGEVMAMSANINWQEQIPDQVDTLMAAAEERYPSAPNVPTMKELGYDVVDCLTRGIAVPKGLPPERLAFLRKAMAEVAQDPEFAKQMKLVGLYPQWWDYKKTQDFIDTYVKENQETFEAMQK